MADHTEKTTPGQGQDGSADAARGKHVKVYHVTIDGTKVDFTQSPVTGAQLKAAAHLDPTYQLFLEAHGHDPDRPIGDNELVDISDPGREEFYSAPPANYGRRAEALPSGEHTGCIHQIQVGECLQ